MVEELETPTFGTPNGINDNKLWWQRRLLSCSKEVVRCIGVTGLRENFLLATLACMANGQQTRDSRSMKQNRQYARGMLLCAEDDDSADSVASAVGQALASLFGWRVGRLDCGSEEPSFDMVQDAIFNDAFRDIREEYGTMGSGNLQRRSAGADGQVPITPSAETGSSLGESNVVGLNALDRRSLTPTLGSRSVSMEQPPPLIRASVATTAPSSSFSPAPLVRPELVEASREQMAESTAQRSGLGPCRRRLGKKESQLDLLKTEAGMWNQGCMNSLVDIVDAAQGGIAGASQGPALQIGSEMQRRGMDTVSDQSESTGPSRRGRQRGMTFPRADGDHFDLISGSPISDIPDDILNSPSINLANARQPATHRRSRVDLVAPSALSEKEEGDLEADKDTIGSQRLPLPGVRGPRPQPLNMPRRNIRFEEGTKPGSAEDDHRQLRSSTPGAATGIKSQSSGAPMQQLSMRSSKASAAMSETLYTASPELSIRPSFMSSSSASSSHNPRPPISFGGTSRHGRGAVVPGQPTALPATSDGIVDALVVTEMDLAPSALQLWIYRILMERRIARMDAIYRVPNHFLLIIVTVDDFVPLYDCLMEQILVSMQISGRHGFLPSAKVHANTYRSMEVRTKPGGTPQPILSTQDCGEFFERFRCVYASLMVSQYARDVTSSLRRINGYSRGINPSFSEDVLLLAKCLCVLKGRDYLIPDDISFMVMAAAGHRLRMQETCETSPMSMAMYKVMEQAIVHVRLPISRFHYQFAKT